MEIQFFMYSFRFNHVFIFRLKIDELNLTIYKLENELSQIRSLNDYRNDHSRLSKLSKSRMSISKPNPFMPGQADVQEKSDFFSKKTLHPNTSVDVKPLPKDVSIKKLLFFQL